MSLNVIVVDDHVLFSETLTSFLSLTPDIRVTAQAASADELFRVLEKHTPDLILLDVEMPGMSGLECAVILSRSHPHLPVLFLTMHAEESLMTQAQAIGNVRGYLIKNVHPGVLLDCIRSIAASAQTDAEQTIGIALHPDAPNGDKLTRQEIAVLRLMFAQLSNEEIAARLSNSVRTIEGHRAHIYHKTGSKTLVGIVQYALEYGLVTLSELKALSRGGDRFEQDR